MIVDIEIDGKKYKANVPDDAPKHLWNKGIIIGPPDFEIEGMPQATMVRLHNELFARGIITERDTRKGMANIQGALQSALKVDAATIVEAYSNAGHRK